jgi:hypothetical protein
LELRNGTDLLVQKRGGKKDEKNLPAEKETEKKGTRIQKENENSGRKKSAQEKKKQRKKEAFCLGHPSRVKKYAGS